MTVIRNGEAMENHNSRVWIVSGGSKGLGSSIVKNALAQGDIACTFSRKKTAEIIQLENDYSDRLFYASIDGQDDVNMKEFVDEVFRRYGRIDYLVNNMSVGTDGILSMMPLQDIDFCVGINLVSNIKLTRFVLNKMILRKQGSIINISSVNALRGTKGVSVYSATKAAVLGFTKSLAKEVGGYNIRVNAVAPGYFDSDMAAVITPKQLATIKKITPLGKLIEVNDVVKAVDFFASKASGITGQVIAVDGGYSA